MIQGPEGRAPLGSFAAANIPPMRDETAHEWGTRCSAAAVGFGFPHLAELDMGHPAAGIADHVWSYEDIAALVPEPEAKKRGPYKKRVA